MACLDSPIAPYKVMARDEMLTACVLFCMIGNGDGTFNLDVGPFLGGYENSGLALGDFNGAGTIELGRSGQ
jgi:hypothetical protein